MYKGSFFPDFGEYSLAARVLAGIQLYYCRPQESPAYILTRGHTCILTPYHAPSNYGSSGPSIVPAARCNPCGIACHMRDSPAWSSAEYIVPVTAVVPVLLAGACRHYGETGPTAVCTYRYRTQLANLGFNEILDITPELSV